MNNDELYIKKIIDVALKGICTEEELHFFLPDYPKLSGSEKIFRIGIAYPKSVLINLIKGCHLIEMEYKELSGYDFGFGSPSKTFNLVEALKKMDANKSKELYDWIVENGGNYYIKTK